MKSLKFVVRPGQGLTIRGKNLTVTGDALPSAAGNEVGDFDRIFVEARHGQLVRPLRNPQPFDLEKAKAGAELITRNGRKARFVAHVPEAVDGHRVLAFVEGQSAAINFYEDGRYGANGTSTLDLFLAPELGEGEINGYSYPEGLTAAPEHGQEYYFPVPSGNIELGLANNDVWHGTILDALRLRHRMVHLTRKAAEAHAKAIIRASGGTW